MGKRNPPRWKSGEWAGLKNYECRHCPFKTLNHSDMQKHADERHPLPRLTEAPAPPTTPERE